MLNKHPASGSDELPLLLTHGHRLMLNASELAEGSVSPQIEAGRFQTVVDYINLQILDPASRVLRVIKT